LVFDEADQLLNAEYALDINLILESCNPKRQTFLYSATLDKNVKKLAQLALKKDPDNIFIYDACKLYTTSDLLKQYYLFVPDAVKDCYLYDLLKKSQDSPKNNITMVFFSGIENCEIAMRTCRMLGIKCAALHSAQRQKDRFQVLNEFKNRRITALFCTDVANRGLDIPSVSYVINYDLPSRTHSYIHRVGRTARAGQQGIAISLVSQYDVKRVQAIERDMKKEMLEYDDINEEQVEKRMYAIAEKRCEAKIQLIDSGFIERYAKVKENRQKTRDLQSKSSVHFERQELVRLKQEFANRAKGATENKDEQKQQQPRQAIASTSVAADVNVDNVTLLKRKRPTPKGVASASTNVNAKKQKSA